MSDSGPEDERAPYDPMPHGPAEVGVGPWEGPWPTGAEYDERLLAEGDRRNVVDRYRYWTLEAIVADLDGRRHDFHVAIENWQHDFNIGTIVRSANAFLAREVHIVGNRRWNRRGAMVTDRYQHVVHHEDVAALAAHLHGLPGGPVPLLGIDNLPGSQHLETMEVPRRVCFLFGQEGPGLSEGARAACDATFSIAQYGSTRSINASAAAAIAMHAWVRAHADLSAPTPGAAEPQAEVSTDCRAARPREVWLLTLPWLMPSSLAVSATESPSQCRSSTVLRCITGSDWSASNSASRSSTGSGSAAGRLRRGPGSLPAPWSPGLVDVGADDDGACVRLLAAVAPHPRPGDVQLDQRDLHQVVGAVPVAAAGVGDPAQLGPSGAHELRELRIALRRTHSRPPPPSAYRSRAKARNASRSGPPFASGTLMAWLVPSRTRART